jgi:hypothetical protein
MFQSLGKLAGAAILALLASACDGTGPEPVEPCSGAIQLGLRSEPLAFVWSPHCGITSLTVTALPATSEGAERPVWGFQVPEQTPLGPGVPYGEAPDRAHVWAGPEPLVIGARYRVAVAYVVGGDVVTASGQLTFTWFPPD